MNQPHRSDSAGEEAARSVDGDPRGVPRGRAIVVGYGLVGRMTADRLRAVGMDVVIVDTNPATVDRQAQLDRAVVHGDATEPDTLARAGLDGADALILTLPDADAAVRACRLARARNPDIFIAVRTNFVSQGMLATEAGADQVIVEEVATAEAMQQAVVDRLVK